MNTCPDLLEALLDEELRSRLPELVAAERGRLHDTVLARLERPLLRLVLARTRGSQVRAAKLLGIHRNTLRRRLLALGLAPQRPRLAVASAVNGAVAHLDAVVPSVTAAS